MGLGAALLASRYALNPVAFVESLGIVPDDWQREVLLSDEDMLINIHRQGGKSTIVALKALWKAIFEPTLIITLSPTQRQSGELFRKVREAYDRVHPAIKPGLVVDNLLSFELENKARVVSLPGNEDTIRGYSAPGLVLIDEAARIDDNLFRSVTPMLSTSRGQLIMMSTPYGKRGVFYQEWCNPKGWKKILRTVDMCSRINREYLEKERQRLGDLWYRQEYYCEFLETEDNLIPLDLVLRQSSDDIEPIFKNGIFRSTL